MTKACSLINKNTQEPKIFFRTDTGDIVSSLPEAIKNSVNSYEFGIFKNEKDFKPLGTTPIFDKNSKEGLIQDLIGENLLEAKVVNGKQVFSVVAETPLSQGVVAESIEEILRIKIGGNHFIRKGETFEFIKDEEYENIVTESAFLGFDELLEKFPAEKAINATLFNFLSEEKTQPKKTKFTSETLINAIEDLLGDLGISTITLDNYKKTYLTKNGVEPTAEALADITNRIIAVAEGKETLDNITEETSHFIVEGWNNAEIDDLLLSVPATSQYKEYAPTYREIYSKENLSKEELEKKVRKEVLGKILAEALKSSTDINSKSTEEQSVFKRVLDFFSKWFNNLTDRISPATSNTIKEFTEEVKNLLYNKKLAESLEFSGKSGVFYSAPIPAFAPQDVDPFNETGKLLTDLFNHFRVNKTSDSNITNFLAILNVIERNIDKINAAPGQSYEQEIKTLVNEVGPLAKNAYKKVIFETALDATLSNRVKQAYHNISGKLTDLELESKFQSTTRFDELKQNMVEAFEKKNSDPKKIEEFKEHLDKKITAVQKDSSWFGKMFMPLYLSSNIFQQMMGSIMMKMWVNINLTMEREITPRVYKLANNVKVVQSLMGDNFIRSFYKNDKLQKDIETVKKQILKDNFPDFTYSETDTMGDIESNLKENAPLFKTLFAVAVKNNEIKGISLKNTAQLEMYEKLGFINNNSGKLEINKETSEHFKIYLNHRQAISFENARIRKDFDITDDNFHKQQSVTKRWVNASRSIFSQDFEYKELDTASFKGFVSTMNQFLKPGLSIAEVKTPGSIEINMKNNDGSGENLFLSLTDPNNAEAVIAFYEQAAAFQNAKNNENNDTSSRASNFKKAWDHFINSFPKGTDPDEINKAAVNWLRHHSSFSTESEYVSTGSKFNKDSIIDTIGIDNWDNEVEDIVGKLDALYRQKSAILNIIRNASDFREIAGSEISPEQKDALRDIEEAISNYIKELSSKTTKDTELFEDLGDDSVFATANKSFMDILVKERAGQPYEEIPIEEIETLFKKEASITNINKYYRLKSRLETLASKGGKTINKKALEKNKAVFDNIAKNLGFTNVENMVVEFNSNEDSKRKILRGLIGLSLPSEYKRYDRPDHIEFIRQVENGIVPIKDLIEGNIPLPSGLLMTPGYMHDSEFDNSKTRKELIIEYAENAETLSKSEKLALLKELDNYPQFEIGEEYKDTEFEKSLKDNNLSESYVALMDLMIKSIHNYESYSHNVFSLPNFRKTGRDTFISLASSKSKQDIKAKAKIFLEETISYREDEMADTTSGGFSFVPKTGLIPLTKEERSSDMIHLYTTMLAQSILYKNRSETLKDAFAIIDEAEGKQYKGTPAASAKTIAKLRETVDLELFGKKELRKLERTILGRTVDLSKLIHSTRKFITMNTLGLSPIIAATAYTTSRSSYEIMKRAGLNREIYAPADSRASLEWKKLLSGTVKSAGTIDGATKLEEILRMYGGYDILARTSNSKFGKALKNLETEKIAFGALKMAEYPILSKMVLSKLMEFRLVGDKFMTFEDFKNSSFLEGTTKKEADLKKEFNSLSNKSLYDYTLTNIDADSLFKQAMELDPSLKEVYNAAKDLSPEDKISMYSKNSELFKESVKNRVNLIQLTKDGYSIEENLEEDLVNISLQIADLKARLTQQLPKGGTVLGQNDTVLSFVMTFRQWLVQTIHNTSANDGKENGLYIPFNNFNTGVTQTGQVPALYNLIARSFGVGQNNTEENKKAFLAFKEAWNNADASEKVALRSLASGVVLWGVLGVLSAAAIGYADDEDEKDNALAQFNAYLLQRTMKEGFGSTNPVGLFNEFLGILNNPITVGRSVKNMAGLLAVWNINDEVKSGQYEGWSKYWTDAFKLTLMKNVYQQTSGEGLKEARTGYRHFSERDDWFSPFETVKVFEKTDETNE